MQSQVKYNIIFQHFLCLFCSKYVKKIIPHLTLLHLSTGSFNHRRNKMHEISIFLNTNSVCSTVSLNINRTQTYFKMQNSYKIEMTSWDTYLLCCNTQENITCTYMHNHSLGSGQSIQASVHPIHHPHNDGGLTQS